MGIDSRPATRAIPPFDDALALARLVRPGEQWRLYCELRDSARYLDIETLGLDLEDDITMVGISDGMLTTVLVEGRDLSARRLAEELAGARLLVTFAGANFDIPRLRRAFPTLPWDLPHLDLAIAGRHVGLRGGLKKVERALGWRRPPDVTSCDGKEAIRLWHAHLAGDRRALLRLIRYCRADVASLPPLAERIVQRLANQEAPRRGWLEPV
ncbi:MAG: ribonuclease H-like domain-containing protein [Planctomycetes bacterium]|nr:ribonuclease H-like domain-containing protein [Planctomycetota bacterium]